MKEKSAVVDDEEEDGEDDEGSGEENMVVEDESKDWPLDADVGWGIRASEYFENHAIRNVVDENGVEIDWEGEMEDNWSSSELEGLKELEKAVKVYWDAKDRLPPRSVKIDINIERDLAYALKVRNCPQILFLRGNRILYREKEIRTSEELVAMIAHFYYNAKRPSWIDVKELSLPY
ncbi:hypothetical protein M0R45_010556 [Rubus argutus]|uniref:Uncharacterized protein n=1 Tax=Rubus argutus TaxID=59490 RepID=A0AAW1Y7M7_RUBAR